MYRCRKRAVTVPDVAPTLLISGLILCRFSMEIRCFEGNAGGPIAMLRRLEPAVNRSSLVGRVETGQSTEMELLYILDRVGLRRKAMEAVANLASRSVRFKRAAEAVGMRPG